MRRVYTDALGGTYVVPIERLEAFERRRGRRLRTAIAVKLAMLGAVLWLAWTHP